MKDHSNEKLVKAFITLVEEVPCCQCCASDEGYVEAVTEALKIIEPELTKEDRRAIIGRACRDFRISLVPRKETT
jgi:hypothetical protein